MNSFALPAGFLLHQRYSIQSFLGQGGFGITYLAYDTLLQQEICIKELFVLGCSIRKEDMSLDSPTLKEGRFGDFVARFVKEARSLAQFRHPHIVRVLDVFQANQTAYMVMDFVKGETLSKKIQREGIPSDLICKDFFYQLLDAVEEVHQKGILHRDIKPGNILVTDKNKVVLIDFGSAREYVEGKSITETTMVSRGYAPLEQYSSRALRGPFTDIYALGATLYFMLTGKVPIEAIDRDSEKLPAPRELNAGVGISINEVVLKAMEMKIENRFQSISAFRESLPAKFITKNKKKEVERLDEETTVRVSTSPQEEKVGKKTNAPKKEKTSLRKAGILVLGAVSLLGLVIFISQNDSGKVGSLLSEIIKEDSAEKISDPVIKKPIESVEGAGGTKEVEGPPKVATPPRITEGTGEDGKPSPGNIQSQKFIQFGGQRWTTQNLEVVQFRNGDPILEAKSAIEWQNAAQNRTPAWCYFNNDPNKEKLYNWFAVADPRGLAPQGWHIPSDQEWRQLVNFFGGAQKAAQELKRNQGFNAKLNGYRNPDGKFEGRHLTERWWSNTPKQGESYAYGQKLKANNEISSEEYSMGNGFPVRLVKN